MRVFFALAIFLLLHLACSSQRPLFSPPIKLSRNISQVGVVDADTLGFYVMAEDQGKEELIHLSRYSNIPLEERWRKSFNIEKLTSESQRFAGIVHLKKHFLLFTSGYNKERDRFSAYAIMISNDGEVMQEPVLLHSIKTQGHLSPPELQWHVSPNENEVLVFFEPNRDRTKEEAIGFKLYSANLELLHERDLLLPFEKDMVQIHQYAIDDAQGVFMLSGKNPEKNATFYQQPQMGRYVVFYFSFAENKLKEYNVSLKDKQVVSVAFDLRKAGELVIGGYYSNDLTTNVAGTFLFELTPKAESIKSAAYTPFAKDFLSGFLNEREMKRQNGISSLYLDKILIQSDSAIYLVGEQYYLTEQLINDISTGRQSVQYVYHFDDMALTRVAPTGSTDWSLRIAKQQYAYTQDLTCSYACFARGDSVSILFNDVPENFLHLEKNPTDYAKAWYNAKKGVTTEVIVAANKAFKRRMLIDNDLEDCTLKPGISQEDPYGIPVLGYEEGRNCKFFLLE
jgi:hypothetical protein